MTVLEGTVIVDTPASNSEEQMPVQPAGETKPADETKEDEVTTKQMPTWVFADEPKQGYPAVPLSTAIASLTIPSADDLLASLLAFLGQHADYGWLRRADRLLLHTAMRNGDEEELTRLLAAAPFLVDATDDGGATALHLSLIHI